MTTLGKRFITAVIMAGLFLLAVTQLPLVLLAAAFAVVAAAGAWEWAALAGWASRLARVAYIAILLAAMVGLWWYCGLGDSPTREQVQPFLGVACFFWSVAMLLVESYPRTRGIWSSLIGRSLMGLIILPGAWLSVIFLATLARGPALVIILIVVVATADVGAYFAGRRWGRHKLAPEVSPGKTWEGLWGGLLAVIAVSLALWASLPNALQHLRVESLVVLGLAMAGASVLGDLTVSMVKRSSGLKDSGSLLPGHGGLLDRLDSICGAAPVYALGLMLVGY